MSYPARLDAMVVKNGILTKECRVYTGWMNLNKLRNFIDNGCIPIQEESGTTLQFYLSKNGVIIEEKVEFRVISNLFFRIWGQRRRINIY